MPKSDGNQCLAQTGVRLSAKNPTPLILEVNQCSQITRNVFTDNAESYLLAVSMDGRVRTLDHVFIDHEENGIATTITQQEH